MCDQQRLRPAWAYQKQCLPTPLEVGGHKLPNMQRDIKEIPYQNECKENPFLIFWYIYIFHSAYTGKFACFFCYFLSSAVFFQNHFFFHKFFPEYHWSDKQLGSRSGPTFCRPDLGSNYLQRLPADDTSMLRVNYLSIYQFFHKILSFSGKDHITDKIS